MAFLSRRRSGASGKGGGEESDGQRAGGIGGHPVSLAKPCHGFHRFMLTRAAKMDLLRVGQLKLLDQRVRVRGVHRHPQMESK